LSLTPKSGERGRFAKVSLQQSLPYIFLFAASAYIEYPADRSSAGIKNMGTGDKVLESGRLYYDLNTYYREIFGCRVQKISIDAGLFCPNRSGTISTKGCIYCNAKGSGTGAFAKGQTIADQISKGKKVLARRYKSKKYIAYFQSFTNTYAPLEKLKKIYDEALDVKEVVGISVGTRPDCVDESVLALLQDYSKNYLVWVEYGLQSAHDPTLNLINRGHDFKCFKKAVKATKARGLNVCVHIILGLPGEDKDLMHNTAKKIAELGVDGIKLHLLYVIKGTALATWHATGRYSCLKQKEYVELVCDFLELLPSDVIVQRLTGDPHPEELVAPLWSLDRNKTFAMIKDTLIKRNSWQGKFAKVTNN